MNGGQQYVLFRRRHAMQAVLTHLRLLLAGSLSLLFDFFAAMDALVLIVDISGGDSDLI